MTEQYDKHRHEQASAPEDLLTSLQDDLLISILSFLPIKQRVALSAVCTRFRCLLPSIPRLDSFRLEVECPFSCFDIHRKFTSLRALIRQCHIVFRDITYLSKRLQRVLVEDLVEAGVQDLILETSGKMRWHQVEVGVLELNGRGISDFFGIKSLRSLSLHRIAMGCISCIDGRRPRPSIALTHLTSLKMERCILFQNDFLPAVLASCPFLETLHFINCSEHYASNGSIHSASIKHLVLLHKSSCIRTIDVRCPKLESLIVDVAAELHIEAPKAQNASLLFGLHPPVDPPDALTKLLGASFQIDDAWLMLKSSTIPNGLVAENEIDRLIYPEDKEDFVIFNLDFDLKDQSSTMILTQFLEKCNEYCDTEFDILVDSAHIQNTIETARDDHLLHGSIDVELIKLRMIMPERTFEGFLSNQKEMEEELKQMGLQKLKSRTSREQFNDILVSNESLVQVSSSITNCIEMKF
ncbi:uncharacterized protein LOC141811983 [Curcuma longa]|uniref:uncharacterized protein LOC141811983 n=1 Tax=Curcuma longa TaxID=136217 RepID=UPI003D9EEC81